MSYSEKMSTAFKRVILLLVLAVVVVFETNGQHPDLTFDHYNVEDGLSQSTVWNIFEDSKGFMWFCTPDGLNKFDGYSFTVYRNLRGDSNSIVSNHPIFIFEDSGGDLWIGHRGGLSKYHYRQDRFEQVYQLDMVNSEYDVVLPLHEREGKIWAWDNNRGMIGFNRHTLKEEVLYKVSEKYLRGNKTYSRYGKTVNEKAFISAPNDAMIVFDFRTLQFTFLFDKISDPTYTGIVAGNKFAVDSLNNLWIPGNGGLIYLDTKTLNHKQYTDNFKGLTFTSCAIDKNGMLWFGSVTNGLYVLDIKTKTLTHIAKKNFKENGLLYNYIESLLTDSSGNIWIGTNGFGIQKFSQDKNKFDHFDLKIGTNAFGGNLVKAIAEDANGNIYVGTFGNGLYVMNNMGAVENFTLPQGNRALGLAMGHNQEMLITNGSDLFSLHKGSIARLRVIAEKKPSSIISLSRSNNQIFFISDEEVFNLTISSNQYKSRVIFPNAKPILSHVFQDSHGRTWIGAQRSFYLMSKRDSEPEYMVSVTKNFVKSFSEDEHGNIWIATVGDLICYHPETGEAEYFNEKEGFANTFFYAALPGNDHKMWVSSNKGLASFDPISKVVKNYSVLDGLQSNEFNTGAYCKLKDGRLAFGGLNGLNIFDPATIRQNPNLPKIAFTNFLVDDKPFGMDTTIVYKKKIELAFNENTFSFEFAALEFTSPENNQYAYMLKGLDKDWVQGGNRRFVRYSKLSPGRYEFKVKASNSDGVWNEKPVIVTIVIHPPFYMRAWFIGLMVLLAVGGVVLVSVRIARLRYRTKLHQLEVNQKIQLERERISRDLHDHVGSQLTYIINQLDGSHKSTSGQEQLIEARETARLTMGNLRETIWALHRETVSMDDFTDHLKEFAMKQVKSKSGMHLDFNEKLSGGHSLNPSKALNLFRIAQEGINNALKHSIGNLITISIEQMKSSLIVTVEDNGQGFNVEQPMANSYGLQNMAFRAKEIGAVLAVSSGEKKGAKIMVTLEI